MQSWLLHLMTTQQKNNLSILQSLLLIVLCVLLAPVILLWFLPIFLFKVLALFLVWIWWSPRGITMLTVYSNSPHWQHYFEDGLLPMIQQHTLILNWSERLKWSMSLRWFAFAAFKGEREFNPMVLYFRPFRWPQTLRYYQPFRDARHAKIDPLLAIEAKLAEWIKLPIDLQRFHPRSSV